MNNEHESTYTLLVRSEERPGRAGNCGLRDVRPERGHRDLAICGAIKPAFCRWPGIADTSRCSYLAARYGTASGCVILKKQLRNMPGSLTLKRERGATPKGDYKIPQTRKHR